MDDILSGMQISDYYRASYMNSVQDVQFERDVSRDFTTSASLVTSASRYDPYENEPKLGTYDTVMAYPFRVAENTGENDYTTIIQSIGNPGNTLNVGYEGVPIDWSTRWDNKVVTPPDLTGLITESMGLQSFQLTGNTTSDGWMPSENASLSSNHPSGSSSSISNELSLSLATSQPSFFCRAGIQDQFSDMNCSRISEHSLNNQHQIHQQTPCNLGDASSCLIFNRPAQLSQCYSGSRYLNAMQEILADFANFSLNQMSSPAIGTVSDANGYEHPSDTHPRGCSSMKHTSRDWDLEHKRKQLLGLLQVVDDQYNRLVDEIHTIISAFHAVAELDPQIHARFALQTVSFLYKNMRERISNLVLAIGAACVSSKGSPRDDKSFEISFIQKQWALQQLKRKHQHLWRPQRGLPERSVSVLRGWMFQNFLHPYPKDAEKDLLALKSGLTRGQVSNWFINARVRLWKPLIEEMYAEMSSRHDGGSRNLWTVHHGRYSIN